MHPTISVIIPTYNRANFICETIDSVLNQTYQDYEIIVVDDGSTDDTKQVLSKYGNRIIYIYQENQQVGAARNNGIRHSKGKYIALLDSDDVWLPQKLEKDIACFELDSRIGLVYSDVIYISSDGAALYKRKLKCPTGDILKSIVLQNFVVLSTAIVRRECFEKVGMFSTDREMSGSEDAEMWIRIASQYYFGYIDEITTKYRMHQTSMTSDPDNMKRSILCAIDTIFANKELLPKISHLKNQVYSNIYTHIAINYYGSGNMKKSREYLKKALLMYPNQVYRNKMVLYTFLRTLFGKKLSYRLRQFKLLIQNRIYTLFGD